MKSFPVQRTVRQSHLVIPGQLLAAIFAVYPALTLYRGVWVAWDEDYDTRVMNFIDSLPEWERARLILVHEREGVIDTVWTANCPTAQKSEPLRDNRERKATDEMLVDVYGNLWNYGGYDGWSHNSVRILDEEIFPPDEEVFVYEEETAP